MPASKKLDCDDVIEVVRLYHNERWSMTRIAKHFGVVRQTISHHLRNRSVPIRQQPPAAQPNKGIPDRDEGVIVTVREKWTGQRRSLHEPGPRIEALRLLAARIDKLDGDWRIICYSTPSTIFGDMRGRGGRHPGAVETQALSIIDRQDLLDRSLLSPSQWDKKLSRKKRKKK